mgnify:CR=1 FL=1
MLCFSPSLVLQKHPYISACERSDYPVAGVARMLPILMATLATRSRRAASGAGQYPFDDLVFCNIGNPQSVGMVPLTFNREVLALLMAPHLLAKGDEMVKAGLMSAEAVARAKEYQAKGANVGAYTDSLGFKFVRDEASMSIDAYKAVFERSLVFGVRKLNQVRRGKCGGRSK